MRSKIKDYKYELIDMPDKELPCIQLHGNFVTNNDILKLFVLNIRGVNHYQQYENNVVNIFIAKNKSMKTMHKQIEEKVNLFLND